MFKECNSAPSSGVVNQIFPLSWWVLYPKTRNPGKGEPNFIGSRTHQYSLICDAKNPQNLRENPTFLNSTWTHHYFWVLYNLSTLFLQQIEFAWNLIVKNRYILVYTPTAEAVSKCIQNWRKSSDEFGCTQKHNGE